MNTALSALLSKGQPSLRPFYITSLSSVGTVTWSIPWPSARRMEVWGSAGVSRHNQRFPSTISQSHPQIPGGWTWHCHFIDKAEGVWLAPQPPTSRPGSQNLQTR